MAPKNRTYSKEKAFEQFGSRVKRKPFQLLEKCQRLSTKIVNASAKSDKNYRQTICLEVRHYSYDLIHAVRKANFSDLGSQLRKEAQAEAAEYIERIYDLIPVMRRCGCITPQSEGDIEKDLCYVRASFDSWLQSDEKRIKELSAKNRT